MRALKLTHMQALHERPLERGITLCPGLQIFQLCIIVKDAWLGHHKNAALQPLHDCAA